MVLDARALFPVLFSFFSFPPPSLSVSVVVTCRFLSFGGACVWCFWPSLSGLLRALHVHVAVAKLLPRHLPVPFPPTFAWSDKHVIRFQAVCLSASTFVCNNNTPCHSFAHTYFPNRASNSPHHSCIKLLKSLSFFLWLVIVHEHVPRRHGISIKISLKSR